MQGAHRLGSMEHLCLYPKENQPLASGASLDASSGEGGFFLKIFKSLIRQKGIQYWKEPDMNHLCTGMDSVIKGLLRIFSGALRVFLVKMFNYDLIHLTGFTPAATAFM